MADITKRLHYFNGQFLEEKDFSDEQEYHLDRLRRHNRLLHTSGIAEGLTVTGVVGSGDVTVGVGTALDNQGRMIVLGTGESLSLNSFPDKTVLVVISYDETGTDPATVGNQGQPTRWEEQPKVQLVDESDAPSEGTHVRLARVVVSGDRTVSSLDTSVRRAAGVRVGGELAIPRLQISSEELPENRWPELTCDDNRRVRLDEHLAVSGDLTAGSITTPGTLTAGNVTTTGTLTLANFATSGDMTVGGSLTVNGGIVGGGLLGKDTVQSQHIVDAAITTDKLADYAVTTNEIDFHAVNNAKIAFGAVSLDRLDDETRGLVAGALLVKDYDLRKRALATVTFTTQEDNGATKPVPVPFRPVFVLVSGFIAAIGHEVITNGYMDATDGTISQKGWGVNLHRNSGIPYFKFGATQATSSCACAHFYDTTTSPYALQTAVAVTVESVTSSGLTVRVSKTNSMQQSVITTSSVTLNFICFGE